MALTTRPPTGAVPWPLVLIEGDEKSGKSWACAEFTASPRVGKCYWIDLGQGSGDEYGAIPGAKHEIVVYDGSFAGLYQAVADIHAEAGQVLAAGGKPVVLIIDDMSAEWELLKDWAADRARSSKSNRKKLEADPNAEIVVSGNYWNDANARHHRLMRLLKSFPGIALLVAHGKAVAVIGADGQPVEGKKTHKVEAQKSLGADASCWLRLFREEQGIIVGGRSVALKFRPGDKPRPLAADWTLEGVIFGVLGCDPATAKAREVIEPKADAVTPEQIRDEALHPRTSPARVRELYTEGKRLGYDEVTVVNEHGDDELLLTLLIRTGKDRRAADAGLNGHRGPDGTQAARRQDAAAASPEADDPWAGEAPDPDGPDPWAAQPPARIRQEDQGAPAPASNGSANATDDPEWVSGFLGRVGSCGTADALNVVGREIGPAIRDRRILAATATELTQAVSDRRKELAGAR